jgi:hypothetical protein
MTELQKRNDENEEQFIWRLGRAKDSGELDLDWEQISEIINKECREDDSEYRNESAYRKPYQQAKRFYEAGVFKDLTGEKYAEIIRAEQRELRKERQKFSDEKLEYNRWLREEARDEHICEKICNAVEDLEKLPIPEPIIIPENDQRQGVLCFADTHYGTEFSIKGLFGEVLNEYSPEIFEKRMGELLGLTVQKIQKENLTTINVFSLGDELDGIIRCSQLMKLRYGVVESAIKYADYICRWLTTLTYYAKVRFHMTQGNHTELRMLGQPKGTFKEENMGKVIKEFIKTRMSDNSNFEFCENESGMIFDTIAGFNVLGIHGEVKSLARAMQSFTNMYDTNIHILVGGHMHHHQTETVGINKDIISVPSVIGIDDYSMQIGKTSNAGATFFIIEPFKGITEQSLFKFLN